MEIIVFSAVNSKLLFKIFKQIKYMQSIKIFVIFSVRTFNLAIVTGSVWLNELVPYPTLFEASLKQCGSGIFSIAEPFIPLSV